MITLRYSLDGGGTFGPWVEVDLPYTIAESKPWHSVVVETVGGEASLLPIATDGIPDPFGFDDVADQAPGEIVESAVVTPTGFNRPAVVTVTGGEYQILEPGGAVALAWRSVAGEILPGQGAQVRGLAPAGFSATSTVSLTIGGVSADWGIGTAAADTTPDAFGFTAATGAGLSAVVASNVITPTGFNSPASIAVIDGEYRIDGGAWTAAAGTISPGSTVQVRGTSSGSHVTATTVSLVIGGVTGTFSITTAADTAPDAFSFTDVTGAARGVYVSSSIIMPVGYAAAAPVTITGGEFSIEAQGFDSEPATISPGEVIQIRALTGSGFLEQSEVTLTIGGVSTTWSVTTVAEDTTPNAFTFTDVTDQALDTFVWSAPITVAGINAPAAISVSGGQYRINGGSGTSSPGTVNNGATVAAGVQTSASNSTAANVTVTIGGVSDTFTATTEAAEVVASNVISMAFGNQSTVALTDQAGATRVANWSNPFGTPNFTASNLIGQDGEPTTLDITSAGPGANATTRAVDDGETDFHIFQRGYRPGSAPSTFTMTEIPYSAYDVLVYFDENPTSVTPHTTTIGDGTTEFVIPSTSVSRYAGQTYTEGVDGNYLRFSGNTSASVTITAVNTSQLPIIIVGMQIVPVVSIPYALSPEEGSFTNLVMTETEVSFTAVGQDSNPAWNGPYTVSRADLDAGLPIVLVGIESVTGSGPFTAPPAFILAPAGDQADKILDWWEAGVSTGVVADEFTPAETASEVVLKWRVANSAGEVVGNDVVVRNSVWASIDGYTGDHDTTDSDATWDRWRLTGAGTLTVLQRGYVELEFAQRGDVGGSARFSRGGAGGAGEFYSALVLLEAGDYEATWGSAGVPAIIVSATEGTQAVPATPASMFGITPAVGGYGGTRATGINIRSGDGAASGGSANNSQSVGAAFPGFQGGISQSGGAGGGGGMGGAGGNSIGDQGGQGGAGITTDFMGYDEVLCEGGSGGSTGVETSPAPVGGNGGQGGNPSTAPQNAQGPGGGGGGADATSTPVAGGLGGPPQIRIRTRVL